MKISIQGAVGSFSYLAAQNLYGTSIEIISRDTFKEVFEDLLSKKADAICIPIENSTYGSIYQNYDFLTKYDFYINAELYLKINFQLIVNPGVKFEEITELYTHPVALGQIRWFLESNPQIKPIEFPDTSGAVEMIKLKNLKNAAAAAGRFSASNFKMEIIKENIQDNLKNYTRFFGISRTQTTNSLLKNKTTIEFELGEEVGSLYKTLEFFNDKGIPLSKIESRPIINTEWEYTFYLDFLAGNNQILQHLGELKSSVKDLRILGSYKKGDYIIT